MKYESLYLEDRQLPQEKQQQQQHQQPEEISKENVNRQLLHVQLQLHLNVQKLRRNENVDNVSLRRKGVIVRQHRNVLRSREENESERKKRRNGDNVQDKNVWLKSRQAEPKVLQLQLQQVQLQLQQVQELLLLL